ncbi:MAG TPA: RluA family pseudouridine synthase [Candidatus Saccharimonadia bacterium]|nr:RluA family pseudouridine synthase [Candidatus Saccharimonadia bacterium]
MTLEAFTVTPRAANERLDVYLAQQTTRPRSQIQRLVKAGLVLVNDRPQRASYAVQAGDKLTVGETSAPTGRPSAPDLPIIYEDDDLFVVDKPAGLLVHPGAGSGQAASVADFARPRTTDPDAERPGIVHRLDRDTSGLLIIAKTLEAKAFLQDAFKRRQIHKTYQLLVVGLPSHEEATIKLPLGRHPAHPLRQTVVSGGREAATSYRLVRSFPGFALLEAQPQSGRTHQLRVHFAALGHPVAGDTAYGVPRRPLGLRRQFLHAAGLQFTAPSGRELQLHSPLPTDLAAALARLESSAEAAPSPTGDQL